MEKKTWKHENIIYKRGVETKLQTKFSHVIPLSNLKLRW